VGAPIASFAAMPNSFTNTSEASTPNSSKKAAGSLPNRPRRLRKRSSNRVNPQSQMTNPQSNAWP
jgi:hypothetical protein